MGQGRYSNPSPSSFPKKPLSRAIKRALESKRHRSQPFPELRFNQLTERDGLSCDKATGVAQDATGVIWISTNNGLNRFDGYRFTVRGNIEKQYLYLMPGYGDVEALPIADIPALKPATAHGVALPQ